MWRGASWPAWLINKLDQTILQQLVHLFWTIILVVQLLVTKLGTCIGRNQDSATVVSLTSTGNLFGTLCKYTSSNSPMCSLTRVFKHQERNCYTGSHCSKKGRCAPINWIAFYLASQKKTELPTEAAEHSKLLMITHDSRHQRLLPVFPRKACLSQWCVTLAEHDRSE